MHTDAVYQITDSDYDVQVDYTYDAHGRIKTSHGESLNDVFEDNSYSYDANSNRTAWTQGSRGVVDNYTAAYNAANQMTAMTGPGGSTTFSYDGNGNLTSDTAGTAIGYDLRNWATSITHRDSPAGPQAATYEGTSQVERTSYGATSFTHSVLGVTSSTNPAEGTRQYVRAPDGRVLAEYRPDGTWRYYLTDRFGSIIGATDSTGQRTESYGYDAYGHYTYGSGGGTDLIHWRYTGAWLDGDSVTGNGFYKIGLRYYDDQTGRWTQTDPLERATNPAQPAEANPYNYAGCNPTNQTDPTGAFSWDCFWTEIGEDIFWGTLAGGSLGAIFGGIAGGLPGAAIGFTTGALAGGMGGIWKGALMGSIACW